MVLEGAGIPTVNIVSDEFVGLFLLEAEQQGIPDLHYVVVSHPIGGVRREAIEAKGRAAVDDLWRAILGGRPA